MFVGVLKTDGGTHPPETWAQVTASQIIDVASSAPTAMIKEAREFEAKLVQMLTVHHTNAQNGEREKLDEHGTEHLSTEIDTSDHLSDAVSDVIRLTKGTSFAEHFAKPEVKAYLERLLHEHFHHSMLVERSWHADENEDHPHAVAFKDRLINGLGGYAGNPPIVKEDK